LLGPDERLFHTFDIFEGTEQIQLLAPRSVAISGLRIE